MTLSSLQVIEINSIRQLPYNSSYQRSAVTTSQSLLHHVREITIFRPTWLPVTFESPPVSITLLKLQAACVRCPIHIGRTNI